MRQKYVVLSLLAMLGLAVVNGQAATTSPEAAIALAKSTLEGKVGIPAATIRLSSATAAEWPDSSLGCPEKGMSYLPVLTPGYVVSLQDNSRTYTVHVAGVTAVICNRAGLSGQQASRARMEQALIPINAAREDLAGRLEVQPAQIEVNAIKRSTWPDASLGCPQPDELYAQVVTPGFAIKLEQGGSVYRYHVSTNAVMLCDTTSAGSDNS
jgi:hypothetical protein